MTRVNYGQKNQTLREIEEEIAGLMGGYSCCSKYIKLMCRNRIRLLEWQRSRIEKDLDINNPPKNLTRPEFCIL